jgi:hypothetical protein
MRGDVVGRAAAARAVRRRRLRPRHKYPPSTPRPRHRPRFAGRGVADGSGLSQKRSVVDRGLRRLHPFKRLRTRYECRADLHSVPL